MGNWSKKFSKVLTAAWISAIVAVGSLVMPIEASAARTVTDNVMIRNDASTEAGIIGSLNEGDEVQILDVLQSADGYAWYYIQLDNGATGYVRSDLIEADDSELAAFRDRGQEETQAVEDTQDTAEEEPAEEVTEETSETVTEENASAQTETAPAQDAAAAANAGTEGYDATKDPNANFRAGYEQEADGTVTWYVYNDDNGSKVKISDLQAQENAAEAGKGGSGIWRTLAIVFGILVLALGAFVLFLLKSIRDGRSKTTRGRALEAAAAARDGEEEEEEEEEEEFFFEDDEPAEDETEYDETGAEDAEESSETQEEAGEDAAEEDSVPAEDKTETADSTITMEIPEEAVPAEIPAEEIEAAIAATTAQLEENISKDASAEAEEAADEEVFEEKPDEEEAEEEFDEEFEEDDDYEDEDYEEDEEDDEAEEFDEEDEDYEAEDYDDEEESESRTARRNSVKGGFFGFLKKMFGSDSDEDAEDPDDGGDFDDYEDETEDHEFDEFKEYPEDIDLLPREETEDSDYLEEDDYSEESADQGDSERGRLSMQRVMKNVSYKEEESDYYREGDPNDLSDSLFEDDDDMEYSFISSRKK